MSFDGRAVWITGGGSGIGKALALELAGRGAAVAVSGRRVDKIEAVAEEIRSKGGQSIALPCDVTDEAAVHDVAERVAEELGGIDVVVANAGFGVAGRFEKLELDEWRRQMDVNVIGLVSTVKEALPHVKERRGSVVLIGSVAAFLPVTGNIAYNASKAAVASIGSTLSAELHGTGVTVTTIHPGFVESEIAQVDNQGRHDASRKRQAPGKPDVDRGEGGQGVRGCDRAAEARVRVHRARKSRRVPRTSHPERRAAHVHQALSLERRCGALEAERRLFGLLELDLTEPGRRALHVGDRNRPPRIARGRLRTEVAKPSPPATP